VIHYEEALYQVYARVVYLYLLHGSCLITERNASQHGWFCSCKRKAVALELAMT